MSKKIIASRLKELTAATDYRVWREVASDLDRLEGADVWKQDETSEEYDYLLIRERLQLMRELRRKGHVRELSFHLAEGLHGNLGNIADPHRHHPAIMPPEIVKLRFGGKAARTVLAHLDEDTQSRMTVEAQHAPRCVAQIFHTAAVTARTRNAAATRAAILDAASLRFRREGYDEVGMRDIARDAGCDPPPPALPPLLFIAVTTPAASMAL